MSLPLLVLPCSDKKLDSDAPAIDFYLGTGYLNILKSGFMRDLGYKYELAFLSAKYGLIHYSEVLSPYDQKLTNTNVPEFVEKHRNTCQSLIEQMRTQQIVAALPKTYLSALKAMLQDFDGDFIEPPAGSGIGQQRGFLKSHLNTFCRGSSFVPVGFYLIRWSTKHRMHQHVFVTLKRGDTFRPWLGNDPATLVPLFGSPKTIASVRRTKSGISQCIDTDGSIWSEFDVKQGLSRQQIDAMLSFGKFHFEYQDQPNQREAISIPFCDFTEFSSNKSQNDIELDSLELHYLNRLSGQRLLFPKTTQTEAAGV